MTNYLAAAEEILRKTIATENARVVEVADELYLELMGRFDRGEKNVRSGRSNGTDRRLGRELGRIYDIETNGTVLPRTVLRGGGVGGVGGVGGGSGGGGGGGVGVGGGGGGGGQLCLLNEFDRKSEALSKKGYKFTGWVYADSEPMEGKTYEKDGPAPVEGKKFVKDGVECILYAHKNGADLRKLPPKRNPCSGGCGKEGGKYCSRCNGGLYILICTYTHIRIYTRI
jgi:hypothetical protein